MKASQIALGSRYENKDSSEVREVTMKGLAIVYFKYIVVDGLRVLPQRNATRATLREFADWAARPVGKKEDAGMRAVRLAKAQMR